MLNLLILKTVEEKVAHPEIYSFWKENWLETFKSLEGKDKVNSDDYLYGEKIVAITYNGMPVSMAIMNSFILNESLFADLKYFNYYPPEVYSQLHNRYTSLQACTYLTVHKEYRKSSESFKPEVPLSELIFAACVYIMRGTSAGGMLGVSRREMGMTKMTKNYGAEVCGITKAHNVVVDLICVDRNSTVFNPLAMNLIEGQLLGTNRKLQAAA